MIQCCHNLTHKDSPFFSPLNSFQSLAKHLQKETLTLTLTPTTITTSFFTPHYALSQLSLLKPPPTTTTFSFFTTKSFLKELEAGIKTFS